DARSAATRSKWTRRGRHLVPDRRPPRERRPGKSPGVTAMRRDVIKGLLLVTALALWASWAVRRRPAAGEAPVPEAAARSVLDRFRDAEREFARDYARTESSAQKQKLVNDHLIRYFGLIYVNKKANDQSQTERVLREALASNPDRSVRAFACYE